MSMFKCRDLIEINQSKEDGDDEFSLASFRLKKATDDIVNIVELQSRGKRVRINVRYTT